MHGEMAYMARDPAGRSDILRWFPEAKSVVLCAFSCHDGAPAPAPDPARGRLARYSQAKDYHAELKERMKALIAWWRENAGGEAKPFIDTSPVLERLYARYAGIGWVGKNTMILSKDIGSFFLIAGIAVDQVLDYDEPVPEHCGTCTRCLDLCPTDAFPRPRVLDAKRCIAYFTAEKGSGEIPAEFRAGHGDWVFGCDVCQDVCPFNRFALKGAAFEPALEPTVDLEELASLSEDAFRERYQGTALLRTGRKALIRNALLAMGNSGDRRHAPTLERFAAGPDPILAEQARWSLKALRR